MRLSICTKNLADQNGSEGCYSHLTLLFYHCGSLGGYCPLSFSSHASYYTYGSILPYSHHAGITRPSLCHSSTDAICQDATNYLTIAARYQSIVSHPYKMGHPTPDIAQFLNGTS